MFRRYSRLLGCLALIVVAWFAAALLVKFLWKFLWVLS